MARDLNQDLADIGDEELQRKYLELLRAPNEPAPDLNTNAIGSANLANSIAKSMGKFGMVAGKPVQGAGLDDYVKGVTQEEQGKYQNELKDYQMAEQGKEQNQKIYQYLMGQKQQKELKEEQIAANKSSRDESIQARADEKEKDRQLKEYIAQMVGQRTAGSNDAKVDKSTNDRFTKLGHDLTGGLASSRSDFGSQQKLQSAADRVLQLGEQAKSQPGGLDKRQIHEIAIATANLVSGGGSGAAQTTIEALVPHSMGSSVAGIEEWLTSNPQGTGQQAFVDRMLETADREKFLAGEKIKGIKSEVLQNYADLQDKDQERWKRITGMHLGNNAQFDEYGRYKPQSFQHPGAKKPSYGEGTAMAAPSGVGGPVLPINPTQISKYATDHGIDEVTARKIIQNRMMGGQ